MYRKQFYTNITYCHWYDLIYHLYGDTEATLNRYESGSYYIWVTVNRATIWDIKIAAAKVTTPQNLWIIWHKKVSIQFTGLCTDKKLW